MAAKKASGRARSSAKPTKSRPGGRTARSVATGSTKRVVRRSPKPYVRGPFWSIAMGAWRIEYEEPDSTVPGGVRTSSVWVMSQPVAVELGREAHKVTNRKQWAAFRDKAMALARKHDVRCWRTMLGEKVDWLHQPAVDGRVPVGG